MTASLFSHISPFIPILPLKYLKLDKIRTELHNPIHEQTLYSVEKKTIPQVLDSLLHDSYQRG